MRPTINYIKLSILLAFGICFSTNSYAQFYNGTQTSFGKNRVQYDKFEWQFYRFEKFETFFYTGGKELAVYTAKYASQRIKQLEKTLDFYNQDKIQFIIYNKQSHFRQSNIGLASNENSNIGGVTNIVGSKVFIYFEGDYAKLEQQIEAGIYKVLIYQMIYGGNWREILRNSALLHLPDWYINGLISFLTDEDNPYIHTRIKDGITNNQFKRFNSLSNEDALIAGHSMWQYIANSYGNNVIPNILYMTRISRNIDDGFLYVLGVPFEDLYRSWLDFYTLKYYSENNETLINEGTEIDLKIRKTKRYENISSNFDGSKIAFNTNKLGQYKIYIFDTETGKKQKIFQDEHKLDRLQDYSYPIIKWHPNDKVVSFITEDKGDIILYVYDTETKALNSKPILKIDKVLSFDYSNDGKRIIFSGINKGQSDLFLYKPIGNTHKNITNDLYDDLNPTFINNEEIVFISNRLNDSLNTDHIISNYNSEKDVFLLNINNPTSIREVTNTPKTNELTPLPLEGNIMFHSNEKGRIFRHIAKYDSTVSHIDTTIHYNHFYNINKIGTTNFNMLETSKPIKNNLTNQITYSNNKYKLLQADPLSTKSQVIYSEESNIAGNQTIKENIDGYNRLTEFSSKSVDKKVIISDYEFETEVKEKKLPSIKKNIQEKDTKFEELDFPTQRIYRTSFKPDNSIIQLNNAFINGQYQIYNGGPFTNPGLGVNTKIGIVDIMEDHRIYGGIRLANQLSEYSLNYQNLKTRLDKEYSLTRRAQRISSTFVPSDLRTLQGSFSMMWPFSEVTSLRGSVIARNDKRIPLAGDLDSLKAPITNTYWAVTKAAYIFDNTRDVALNIKYGTRFKFFFEYYQLVFSEPNPRPNSNLSVFGFDFRNYQEIHKEIILVSRLAGSKSFGTNPLVYYLGGVDEAWNTNFDENTPIDNSQNYGFQALASNMRGFFQNVRNGNNFVVMNNEIRIPVFTYLINRPIQSNFIRDFQLVGFGDIGTAWVGDSPFAEDNPFNNEIKQTGPITVTYENINDPIVGGFGFGVRTTLLGYFMRLDWGWGVENGIVSDKPLVMFSLSLDI